METERKFEVTRKWEKGRTERYCTMANRVSVWGDDKVLEIDSTEGDPTS